MNMCYKDMLTLHTRNILKIDIGCRGPLTQPKLQLYKS